MQWKFWQCKWTNQGASRRNSKRSPYHPNKAILLVEPLERRELLSIDFLAGQLTVPPHGGSGIPEGLSISDPNVKHPFIEPFISVNPKDPGQIAISSHNNLAMSNNSGLTFSPTATFPVASGGDTSTAYDADGRLYWANIGIRSDIHVVSVVQVNPVSGVPIGNPSAVETPPEGFEDDKEYLAVSGSTLYMAWVRVNEEQHVSQIVLSRSTDRGATWLETPVIVSLTREGHVHLPTVSIGPNSDVYVAYHSQTGFIDDKSDDHPDGSSGATIVARYNPDLTEQLSKSIVFTPGNSDITFNVQAKADGVRASRLFPGTQFLTAGSAQPWVLADPVRPGHVYVIAADDPSLPNGGTDDLADVVLARSVDYGVHWETQTLESGPTGSLQLFPTAAIDQFGDLVVAWYDNRRGLTNTTVTNGRNDSRLDVFAKYSTDGGLTWSDPFQVNDPSTPFDPDANPGIYVPQSPKTTRIGEYFGIALFAGTAYVAWNGNTFDNNLDPNGQQVYFSAFPINGTLVINGDEAGPTDDSIVVRPMDSASDRIEAIVNGQRQYAGLQEGLPGGITINGGHGNDAISVAPSAVAAIAVNGGGLGIPASPGDALQVDLAGVTNPYLVQTSPDSGRWIFGNRQPIIFTGIANALSSGGLVQDDFNDNSLDTSKWTTSTNVPPPHGPARVTEQNQHIELLNRGHLITAQEFDPTIVGPIRITGTWDFPSGSNLSSGDYMQVLTRSDGIPSGAYGETLNGIEFAAGTGGDIIIRTRINGSGGDFSNIVTSSVPGGIGLDRPFTFTITDDGDSLSFSIDVVGGGSASVTAANSLRFASNHIVFHNREFTFTNNLSYLDNVVLSTTGVYHPPPTATVVGSSSQPSVEGQLVAFTASVTSQVAGAATPTGTVQFQVDGQNVGSPVPVASDGTATSGGIVLSRGSYDVTANYINGDGNFLNSSSSLVGGQEVNAVTSANLQTVLASTSTPTLVVGSDTDLQTIISAVNGLSPAAPATITVELGASSFQDVVAQPPTAVTLVLVGDGMTTTVVGESPALTVTAGTVIVTGVTFTTDTDAPTILVTGGSLALRDDRVEESSAFIHAAISITGGSVDLGSADDPGGNILNTNGIGEFVHNTTPNPVTAFGNTLEAMGGLLSAPYLSFTGVTSSVNSSVFGQEVSLTAIVRPNTLPGFGTPGGAVDFYDTTTDVDLGSVALSAGTATLAISVLGVGSHVIQVSYNGDGSFAPSLDGLVQQVDKATPIVTWSDPADIPYGMPLSSTELNTSASVPGLFTYTPALGTVLNAGTSTLSVAFTPNDTTDYNPVTQTVHLTVEQAPLTVTAKDASKVYGQTNLSLSYTITGFVNGDTSTTLSGSASLTTTGTTTSPVGTYAITVAQGSLSAANYTFGFVSGTLAITPATLTVTANNASMVYGSAVPSFTDAITGFVNNDNSGVVSGSASLTTTATSSGPVGTYTITAAQGSLSAANYTFAFVNGTLTIAPVLAVASTATVKALQNISTGSVVLANFSVKTGKTLNLADFTTTVDWKDGSALDTTTVGLALNAAGTQVIVSGRHKYATGGAKKPVVTLYDGSYFVTATATINVANDVTSSTGFKRTGYTYNRSDQLYYGTLTVTNNGSQSIAGSLGVVLQGLTAGVTLHYASVTVGTTTYILDITTTATGDPVITIPKSLVSKLDPGKSLQISLRFKNPSAAVIGYNPQLFSDPFSS